MPVYFIQAGEGGPIKIGSAANVQRRLSALQAGSPVELKLLRSVKGGVAEERWFQEKFAHLKLRREWFRFDTRMLSLEVPIDLTSVRGESFVTAGLPSPDDVERQAAIAGLTLKELCARAGIAQSTFYRWRSGNTEPQIRVYRRIKEVLREAGAVQ